MKPASVIALMLVLAYIPCIVFAVTSAYLVIDARYWPAFFVGLVSVLATPEAKCRALQSDDDARVKP
jgi:hypothetical protein